MYIYIYDICASHVHRVAPRQQFNLSKVPFGVALPFPRSLDADGRLTAKYIAP